MYPNPQDVLPLPPHPDLGQYRKRAKELVKASRAGDGAIRAWAARWEPRDPGPLAEFARDRLARTDSALTQAQLVIARAHGFASWTRFARHVEERSRADSEVSAFERAADAIVSGETAALERLLAANPGLVRERSTRDHRATLLHYVSANGVENYRQKTPANIVAIARRLLDAGSEVDAEAEVYGGGATTLGLVVTSAHPRAAGVQHALADLLIERGARIERGIVRACLMNGCPEAAEHMAARGAALDLVGAAGIGRLDAMAKHLEAPGGASPTDGIAALRMATWYDRREAVAFLLDHGVDTGARDPTDGATALHLAAHHGNARLVELLLARGAPVNVNDAVHGSSPLAWALHAWLVERRPGPGAEAYRTVVRMLAGAGAAVGAEWLGDERVRGDPELRAALGG
jgi:hypothetical protein